MFHLQNNGSLLMDSKQVLVSMQVKVVKILCGIFHFKSLMNSKTLKIGRKLWLFYMGKIILEDQLQEVMEIYICHQLREGKPVKLESFKLSHHQILPVAVHT